MRANRLTSEGRSARSPIAKVLDDLARNLQRRYLGGFIRNIDIVGSVFSPQEFVFLQSYGFASRRGTELPLNALDRRGAGFPVFLDELVHKHALLLC